MNRAIVIVLWIFVLLLGGLLAFYQISDRERAAVASPEHDGRVFVDIPWTHLPTVEPFELISSEGKPFDSKTLAGKPYIVNFFFTACPTICRELNDQVMHLANEFRNEDAVFLSISCDPENDTPEKLAEYSEGFGRFGRFLAFKTLGRFFLAHFLKISIFFLT